MITINKFYIKELLSILVFVFISIIATGQDRTITPYDNIPGNILSYKPAFQEDYPEWAKMLYKEDISYNEISSAFQLWESTGSKEHRAIRRYYKMWSRNISPWVGNDGFINLPDMKEYNKTIRETQTRATSKKHKVNNSEWTFLGPKETYWLNEVNDDFIPGKAAYQANVYSFDVAETNTDILYCGTETGYVNKSIDKGNTWQQLGLDYHFGGGVIEVMVDYSNEDVVYVSAGTQLHKSEDGGATWSPLLSIGDNFAADRLEMDKSNTSKIYAASRTGLYISNDAGISWIRAYDARVYDVHRHPIDENIIYGLSTSNTGNFRLIISRNGGITFENLDSFPQNIEDVSGGLLAVSSDRFNSIFCMLLSSNGTPLLYRGEVDSDEWTLLVSGQTPSLLMDNWQGYYDLVLEVSDEDANLIYTGTASLYKSTNGGSQFDNMGGYNGRHSLHPDIQDMKILGAGEVWVSTDGGMNYTSDNFNSSHEVKNNLLIGSDMWGFDQSWNEDLIVGGRYHNGNTAIADFYGDKALRMGGAESPTGWVSHGRDRHVAFDDLGAGWILPKTAEGMPEGRFLFSNYPNMDEYGGRRSNLLFHTNYFGHLLLGQGNGLWKSTDSGKSYNMIYDFGNRVRWMQASYSNSDVIYADIVNVGLMRSEDGGFSWESKPSLTSAPNGNNGWAGRLFIQVSPTDENTVYACLQNGTWSADIGRIFKSNDGGDTWEDWTGGLQEYTKSFVIQPDANGEDLVYLFTNARDREAKVFSRSASSDAWEDFSNGYPAGFHVNLALPFFRDSKIRVSGNGGIWESPLEVVDFSPIINPWVEKATYACTLDTVYFEDHSIIDHEDLSWNWVIIPAPAYISDKNIRNPVVVLGNEGGYDVTMTIMKNGEAYSKTIENMITAQTCPSVEDCNNPAFISKADWELVYVDSEEPNAPGLASMAFDDDPSTIWHTRWTSGNDSYPHEMIVDMGTEYLASSFTYLPRQNGENGRIKDFELYVSQDLTYWGTPVSEGEFTNTSAPTKLDFEPKLCRYFRIVCLSEQNNNIWSSAAEFSMVGCIESQVSTNDFEQLELTAFPVPSQGIVHFDLSLNNNYHYKVYDATGVLVTKGAAKSNFEEGVSIDLSAVVSGTYFIQIESESGVVFTSKVVKI